MQGSAITLFFCCGLAVALAGQDAPLDARQEERLLTNSRQLIFEGRRSGEGYFSRDGSLLVFQSEREPENPFFQIYLLDMTSGDTRRVSPGHGKTTCAWLHPSNRKVLFASTHLDPDARAKQKAEYEARAASRERRYGWEYDENYDLFECDLATGALRRLTDARGYDAEASWSPDGKRIVFASNRVGYEATLSPEDKAIFDRDLSYLMDIYLMDADGSNVRRLTDVRGYDGGPFFNWSGDQICWRRFSVDGSKAEVYVMDAAGARPRQITNLGAMSWAPFFHPSDDYLIFATNLHGFSNFELYLVDVEGKCQPVRVTFTDGFDGLPAFSPDGKRLAWTCTRTSNKQGQIFIADWNDAEARKLLGLPPAGAPRTGRAGATELPNFDLGRTAPQISAADLKLHVSELASEKMQGRMAGTEGLRLATDYVASVMRSLGLTAAGENGSYFQTFEFTAGASLGSNNRLKLADKSFAVDRDWRPLAFAKSGSFGPAPVVFAGYGMTAPKTEELEAYDSFQGLDVKGKWALVLRYLPDGVAPEMRQHLSRFSGLRYKAMAARERGALGLLIASGPNSKVREQLVKMTSDVSLAGSGIAAVSITDDLAREILRPSGRDLQELQTALDSGKVQPGFAVPDSIVEAVIDIVQEKRTTRNVLARLEADGAAGHPAIVVGAHVDHLGDGTGANSLAREDEKGKTHYGADDNASGVAGLLEIAQFLADRKAKGQLSLQKDVLFAAWSAEELGLLGSAYFARAFGGGAERPQLTPDLAAYLNLDMIGRLDKKLILQGVGSSSVWGKEIERRNAVVGLPVVTQNESYLPTDATSFYLKKVPVLSAFTGAHEDYHTPRDTPDRLNYEGAQKIASLFALIAESLIKDPQAPDYKEMEPPKNLPAGGGRRVYLGTIPDFSQGDDVVGVKISGAQKGGPAERAGLQAGDVIVELAGKAIANIYDYQFAMSGLKVGEAVSIVVMRGRERLALTITPGSRE